MALKSVKRPETRRSLSNDLRSSKIPHAATTWEMLLRIGSRLMQTMPRDQFTLTKREQELRTVLIKAAHHVSKTEPQQVFLRFAGGWVRDKVEKLFECFIY